MYAAINSKVSTIQQDLCSFQCILEEDCKNLHIFAGVPGIDCVRKHCSMPWGPSRSLRNKTEL
jgi:hypothetical protein